MVDQPPPLVPEGEDPPSPIPVMVDLEPEGETSWILDEDKSSRSSTLQFYVYAQKAQFIGENGTAFFLPLILEIIELVPS